MSSTKWSSELRDLFKGTQARFPNQKLEPESIRAFLEDWREWLDQVGWARFVEAVKRARSYSDFFPSINLIKRMTPDPRNDNGDMWREMEDLKRRKAAGEKFYSLAECLLEFADQVETGKIKGRDERGQQCLETWAKKLKADHKAFAAKMLEDSTKKRPRSELSQLGEIAK